MKYHEISRPPKLIVRRTTVPAMFEDAGILERMERHGWVRPIDRARKKCDTDKFSVSQLEAAAKRMETEPLPE